MVNVLLNTVALDPNRWTRDKSPYFDLNDLLEPMAESGFDALEIWQYHVSTVPVSSVRRYRSKADDLGLSFEILGYYPCLHLDGAAMQEELCQFSDLLEKAHMLGVQALKMFVGRRSRSDLSTALYRRSLENLLRIAEQTCSNGFRLIGELHVNTLFDSVENTLEVLRDVNLADLEICYQPFDFRDTTRMLADYARLAERVTHLHFQGRRGDAFVDLKDAELDYGAFINVLVEHAFSGYASIEFVKDCVVKDPASFDLRRVLQSAIRDRDYLTRRFAQWGMEIN